MSDGAAYRTTNQDVVDAFHNNLEAVRDVQERRDACEASHGRELVAVRSGFGHGSTVVGFERRLEDDDNPALKHNRRAGWSEPRLSTPAGKALAQEFAGLSMPGLVLPGMPEFKLVSNGMGIATIAPAALQIGDTIWVHWSRDVEDQPSFDPTVWEKTPLSVFFAAKEADDAAQAVGQ